MFVKRNDLVIKMLHCVKGFFEVPPCASPTTAICHPNELNTDNVSCFFRYHLIASGGFVELGTTTSIEVSFNDIDGFICFYYEVQRFVEVPSAEIADRSTPHFFSMSVMYISL